MSMEKGFDASEYANWSAKEGAIDKKAEAASDSESIAKRVQLIKEWLLDVKDVSGKVLPSVYLSTFTATAEITTSGYLLSLINQNTAASIIFGLASGMKVGEFAGSSLQQIQDELNDPDGRYRRETRRIENLHTGNDIAEIRAKQKLWAEADRRYEAESARRINPEQYLVEPTAEPEPAPNLQPNTESENSNE